MTTDHDDTASSPTDHAITELQLHGYRPFQDEPDPRPLPEGRLIAGAVADIFDALIVSLCDTRLEPDLDDLPVYEPEGRQGSGMGGCSFHFGRNDLDPLAGPGGGITPITSQFFY